MRCVSSPSLSFGSNHVLFGAAVGDVEQLPDADGMEAEGDRHLAAVDPFLKLGQPPYASHEIDALVGPLVLDAQQPVQHPLGKQGHIEHADGVVPPGPRPGLEQMPGTRQVNPEAMGL
jgi:hypothetical protein